MPPSTVGSSPASSASHSMRWVGGSFSAGEGSRWRVASRRAAGLSYFDRESSCRRRFRIRNRERGTEGDDGPHQHNNSAGGGGHSVAVT